MVGAWRRHYASLHSFGVIHVLGLVSFSNTSVSERGVRSRYELLRYFPIHIDFCSFLLLLSLPSSVFVGWGAESGAVTRPTRTPHLLEIPPNWALLTAIGSATMVVKLRLLSHGHAWGGKVLNFDVLMCLFQISKICGNGKLGGDGCFVVTECHLVIRLLSGHYVLGIRSALLLQASSLVECSCVARLLFLSSIREKVWVSPTIVLSLCGGCARSLLHCVGNYVW